jgi:hypothetical protein
MEFSMSSGVTPASPRCCSGDRRSDSARVPDAFNKSGGKVARLYPDYRAEEMLYYAATGIYPIMHVIAMRRVLFERYPWVAMNLFKAFDEPSGESRAIQDLTASRIRCRGQRRSSGEWSKNSTTIHFLRAGRKS